jgi:S1-C subfamily serine protease
MRPSPLALSFALAIPAAAEAASGLDATVFIRVTGDLRGEYQHAWKETVEVHDVEIATGSGFVISPSGYILTNHHVVAAGDRVIEREGQEVTLQVEVTRIEVLFPGDGTRLLARVEATDPETDLAVLSVGGADLPFIRLGDSDALRPGQPIQVMGFPLGRAVNVGKRAGAAAAAVPQATISRGSVAALRTGDEGDARYIQTDAAVQPGSSGGPMVDEQGYAVGVIRMMLGRRPGVAFAIPINRVKDFLQSSGHERVFPARRLTLGALQSFDRKGLRLRVPDAFEDGSPSRLRLEWTPPEEVALSIERVASPLSLADLESAVLAGRDFPGFVAATAAAGRRLRLGQRAGVMGWAIGSSPDGHPLETGYAIVDLGPEKVVARYAGPPAQVAFNRSIFGGSLESLEADPLLTAEVAAPLPAALAPLRLPHRAAGLGPYPAGWHAEPSEFSACGGLPAPEGALALSPEGDFTVLLRVAWWRAPAPGRDQALAACGAARDFFAFRDERLGVVRHLQGSFLSRGGELWGFEMATPVAKQPFVRDLFGTWIGAIGPTEEH